MKNKHPKGRLDTPHHIEFLRKDEDDERRDKRRCLFFTKNKCSYYNGQCIGSSHCNYYQEDKQKAAKRSSKAVIHRTYGKKSSKEVVCAETISPEKLMFKNTLLEAQRKNVQAMYNVAQFYEYGKGVQQDYEQAERWYKQAADNGNPYALTAIKKLNEKYLAQKPELLEVQNDSVKENKNDVAAVSMASQNSLTNDTQKVIEDSLTLGKRALQNKQWNSAYHYLEEAALSGNAEAICQLADLYYKGFGHSADYRKAFQLYEKAALLNNAYAMHQIGIMYSQGQGVLPSSDEAAKWLQKAIDKGDLSARADYEWLCNNNQPKSQPVKVTMQDNEFKKAIFQSIIFVSLVIVFIFSAYYVISRHPFTPVTTPIHQVIQKNSPLGTKENPYVITAEGLMGKYNENISETNNKYKGKYVKVSGTVIHQGRFNNSDNIAVCIYRWNFNGKRYDILGDISEQNKAWAQNLQLGSPVVITGKFIGAVEQKNKNVISLQILVVQPPQVKNT